MERLQRQLSHFNRRRLRPQLPDENSQAVILNEVKHRILEARFLDQQLADLAPLACAAPRDPGAFIVWFETLEKEGPGQNDALFPWLAEHASLEDMKWFLEQEVAGEAGFEDLVALTQVSFPIRAKLELARNYWDEMGRGGERGMHGPMLSRLATALNLDPKIETTIPEALMLGNVMIGFATNRHLAYHSIGALGVIELTAPGRAQQVARGLRRLGIESSVRHYFDVHAILDVKHSIAWNREVIMPLAESDAAVIPAIAAGALLRLTCGSRCFERYRAHFAQAMSSSESGVMRPPRQDAAMPQKVA
jgi:hypothetical protein